MPKKNIEAPQLTAELDKILSTKPFAGSPLISKFLHFVINEKLAGREHLIKEYTIATEVLGRKEQFLHKSDASVRIHAIRLRKLLEEYYQHSGPETTIRIEIPKGTYRPVFSYIQDNEQPEERQLPSDFIPEDSICIVPFTGLINNKLFNFSPIGFCEYLREKLSLFQDISVFSLQSVEEHLQSGGTVEDLGKKLGVTYYLTGSLEIDERNFLVSVQLHDASANSFIWSHDFEVEITNNTIAGIAESITSKIVSSLAGYSGYIHYRMFNPGDHKPEISNKLANAVFWAYRFQAQHSEQVFYEAIHELEKAIQRESDCALCYAVLAHLYIDGIFFNYYTVSDPLGRAGEYVAKALAIDPICQHAFMTQAWLNIFYHNKKGVMENAEKMYSLNPNSSFFTSVYSLGMAMVGEYKLSFELLKKAIYLNPLPYWWLNLPKIFFALKEGRYQEALFHAQKQGTPKMIYQHVFEMIALYYLKNNEGLEELIRQYKKQYPGRFYFVSQALPIIIFDEEVNDKVTAALSHIKKTYFSERIEPGN